MRRPYEKNTGPGPRAGSGAKGQYRAEVTVRWGYPQSLSARGKATAARHGALRDERSSAVMHLRERAGRTRLAMPNDREGEEIDRRSLLTGIGAAVALGAAAWRRAIAAARQSIRIGFGMAQTGGIATDGRMALLGTQIWRDDVKKAVGRLSRPVEFAVYETRAAQRRCPAHRRLSPS
jgi:hypothetical protein